MSTSEERRAWDRLLAEVERLRMALREIAERAQVRHGGMGVHSPRDYHLAADERARLLRAIDEALNPEGEVKK